MKLLLTLAGLVSLFVGFIFGFLGHLQILWASLIAMVFLLLCANADRVAEVTASSSGISAKTRELVERTEGAITEIQALTMQLTKLGFSLVKRQGRISGFSAEEEQQIKADMLEVVRRVGVNESAIEQAIGEWNSFEELDYARGILGSGWHPSGASEELLSDWLRIRDFKFGFAPSPQALREFLEKHELLDVFRGGLVDDYEYFKNHRRHRRPNVWAKRDEWPPLNVGPTCG